MCNHEVQDVSEGFRADLTNGLLGYLGEDCTLQVLERVGGETLEPTPSLLTLYPWITVTRYRGSPGVTLYLQGCGCVGGGRSTAAPYARSSPTGSSTSSPLAVRPPTVTHPCEIRRFTPVLPLQLRGKQPVLKGGRSLTYVHRVVQRVDRGLEDHRDLRPQPSLSGTPYI